MSYMYLAYLGMLLQICFIYLEQQKKYVPAVIQKGAASLVFVLIGFLGLSVATIPTFAKVVVALAMYASTSGSSWKKRGRRSFLAASSPSSSAISCTSSPSSRWPPRSGSGSSAACWSRPPCSTGS